MDGRESCVGGSSCVLVGSVRVAGESDTLFLCPFPDVYLDPFCPMTPVKNNVEELLILNITMVTSQYNMLR